MKINYGAFACITSTITAFSPTWLLFYDTTQKKLLFIFFTWRRSLNRYKDITYLSTLLMILLTVSKWGNCDSLTSARKHIPTRKGGGKIISAIISVGKATSGQPRCAVWEKILPKLSFEPWFSSKMTLLNYSWLFTQVSTRCFCPQELYSTLQGT